MSSCIGMLVLCNRHGPALLKLGGMCVAALLLFIVADHVKLHEHKYDENDG